MGMRAFRKQLREWGLGLALLALLLQTFIPLAQAVPVQRGNADSGFDSLIICTAWGVKLLQLSSDEEPPVKPTAPSDCPVCSVHSLKLPLPGFDAPAPEPVFQAGLPVRADVEYLPPEQAYFTHSFIRAPPLA